MKADKKNLSKPQTWKFPSHDLIICLSTLLERTFLYTTIRLTSIQNMPLVLPLPYAMTKIKVFSLN